MSFAPQYLHLVIAFSGGLFAGTFLNGLISRIPRSYEPAEAFDNPICTHFWGHLIPGATIPILSFLKHRKACAICGAPIPGRFLVVEIGTAVMTLIVTASASSLNELLVLLGFTYTAIILAVIDLEERLLPNEATVPLLACALLVPQIPLESAVQGMAIGFGFMWFMRFVFLKLRGVEGLHVGDVQLAGVIGAWVGVESILLALCLATFLAGGMALFKAISERESLSLKMELPFGGPLLASCGVFVLGID